MTRMRERESQIGLLPRMEARTRKDGYTFRYHPVGGKPIGLGRDKVAALRKVLDMLGQHDEFGTLQWVWERYTDADKPAARWQRLSDASRADYRSAWKQIDKTFGKMQVSRIDSTMVARYVHIERAAAPRRATIEKALLSCLFGHSILLGVCKVNATSDVQPHPSEARAEAPDGVVLERFLTWLAQQSAQRRVIGMAAEYASLAGNRQVEFLPLTWLQVDRKAGVIRTVRAKQRGKKRDQVVEVISISERMAALLDRLEALRAERGIDCSAVFPTRDNNAYTGRGFKTLWNRCVHAAMEAGALAPSDRFTFHDLRAYYATKHKHDHGALPDLHKNRDTTARVYDRSVEVLRRAV